MLLTGLATLAAMVSVAVADYQCLCSYQVELNVNSKPNGNSDILGILYEFDCKPTVKVDGLDPLYASIVIDRQIGYAKLSPEIHIQVCQGEPQTNDRLPSTTTTTTLTSTTSTTPVTVRTTVSTTPLPLTTVTTQGSTPTTTILTTTIPPSTPATSTPPPPTTSTTTTPTTTTSTTTTPTTTTPLTTPTTTTPTTTTPTTTSTTTTPTPTTTTPTTTTHKLTIHGDISQCPTQLVSGAAADHIFQRGQYCYEYVNRNADWYTALHDCPKRGGVLFQILDQDEQNFIYKMLATVRKTFPVWLGLHDVNLEERFQWVSDAPLSYTNWMPSRKIDDYHNQEDCVVYVYMRHGQWDDTNCMGILFDHASYPWICQYNTTRFGG